MTDGIEQIGDLAGAMLRAMQPGERRQLLRKIARTIATSQRERIGRQQDPDGAAYAPRKPKRPETPGAFPLRFMYPKGAAAPRLVEMTSWVRQGPIITGYDREAGGMRSFFWDKIASFLPADDLRVSRGKTRRRGGIRQRAMFRKLRNARNLRGDATDSEAWIGFSGRASAIAQIHQEGGEDRPSTRSRPVRYARRVLLGLSEVDRSKMLDMVLQHFTAAST